MLVRKSTYDSLLHEHVELQQEYATAIMESEDIKADYQRLFDEFEDHKLKSISKEKTFFVLEFHDDMETVSPVGYVKDRDGVNKLVERGWLASNKVDDSFAVQLALAAASTDFMVNMIDAFSEELEEPDDE
jgi:hypothetical protein